MKFCRVVSLLLALFLTLAVLPQDVARAEELLYTIAVDLSNQIVTVYTVKDGSIVRQTICSSGAKATPTVEGTFAMPAKRKPSERKEWYDFSIGSFAHYATRIYEGYMFHSYLYNRPNESTLNVNTVAYLGVPVSHGCMRMRPDDAEWIAKNCPQGTKVKIFQSGERDEYLRALLKQKSFYIGDGVSYNEFVGGATHDGELAYGSTGEQVRSLQHRMLGLGLYSGKANGRYDADMVDTISALQRVLGLTVDGRVNKSLWDLLFSEDAPTCDLSDVSVGASGPMVSYVQALLKKASLYEGEITGTFDAATDAAVRKYQNYAGLPVDGILTKEQQASLVDLIDELRVRFPDGYALKAWNETQIMATIETKIRLNVREEPSTESRSLGQLMPQSTVRVLSTEDDEWTQIEYGEGTGYILSEYTSTFEVGVPHYDFTDEPDSELQAFDETAYAFTPLLASTEVVIGTGTKSDNMIFYLDKTAPGKGRKVHVAFGLLQNSSIELEDYEDGWAKATYCGVTGYIPANELKVSAKRVLSSLSGDGEGVNTARNLGDEDVPVYANVSVNSDVLGYLGGDERAEVLKQGDDWSQISFNGSVGYIENDRVQIGMLSDKLEQYVAGISHYLTHEGAIEGVTMSTGNLALVQAISREEAMAERNPNAADADGDGDYVPMDDEGDYGVGSTWADLSNYDYSEHGYDSEDVDTSAAREAFDAADQENEFRAEDEFGG